MSTKDYSLMMMESEHMVDGDDIGDDGGKDDVEIPLFGVEIKINLTKKTKILIAATLYFTKHPSSWQGMFSGYIRGYAKRGDEAMLEGQTDIGHVGCTMGPTT